MKQKRILLLVFGTRDGNTHFKKNIKLLINSALGEIWP